MLRVSWLLIATSFAGLVACSGGQAPSPRTAARAEREQDGRESVVKGEPIDVTGLEGRIVFDDFEDLYVMHADGSRLRQISDHPGPQFDGAWAPDGRWIAYRDSRRGINNDDEIYIARADGSGARNLTRNEANDWGPDWSPDGKTIIFNSDRDGGPMSGYLVSSDGTGLQRIDSDVWIEYASFSPDGTKITFMGHEDGDYDIFVADLETGATTRLTDAPGGDGWPTWSPDGSSVAFTSERDDCLYVPEDEACWVDRGGDPGGHRDVWVMDADGSNQRRVTPESGQFVAWSPDGDYLLISGASLYVVRPDGTGRSEISAESGGIPDWVAD